MRAAVMFEPGGRFEVRDVTLAEPGPLDVVVRLKAAGVCASDLALTTVFGQPTPVVLGHEGAGIVERTGAAVTEVKEGDRVLVLWIAPCQHCKPCLRGFEYLCASRSTSADARAGRKPAEPQRLSLDGQPVHQGMRTGTFAEYVLVPENALTKLEDDLPFAIASMMGCAIPTGVGAAIRSAGVKPGDNTAIIGCGAVGLSALFGAIIGGSAELIAVDPLPERRAFALSLGATAAMSPEEFADGKRDLDVVIDAVGAPATVGLAWKAARRGGTITVVGAGAPSANVQISAYELFHDDKRLTGSFAGGISLRRELSMLTALWRTGHLPVEKLMHGEASLDQINDVVKAQKSGAVVRTPILFN
jgi:S-(hydroxymethyl)glutathione dehydrogenase/alcohol dehydrogenase